MASTATCAQFVCVVSRWCQGVGAMHLRWAGWPSGHRRSHRFSPPPWQQPFLSLPPIPKTKQLPFWQAHAASAAPRGRLERPPQHLRHRRTRPGQRSCRRLGAAGVRLASERTGRHFSFGASGLTQPRGLPAGGCHSDVAGRRRCGHHQFYKKGSYRTRSSRSSTYGWTI